MGNSGSSSTSMDVNSLEASHNENVPCPQNGVVKYTDKEVGYKYVEFPDDVKKNIDFMESIAINNKFQEGVGYVPVRINKDGHKETHIYCIDAEDGDEDGDGMAQHCFGPIYTEEGKYDNTVFGSTLSSDGKLYLCVWNLNMVVCYDLKTIKEKKQANEQKPEKERFYEPDFKFEVAAPNDVTIDPKDESVLYVAVGSFTRLPLTCTKFSNAARGRVVKVFTDEVDENNMWKRKVATKDLNVLAGLIVKSGVIWVAQLFDVVSVKQAPREEQMDIQPGEIHDGENVPSTYPVPERSWYGRYEDAASKEPRYWLADNMDVFDDEHIITPAYRTIDSKTVNVVLKRGFLSGAAGWAGSVLTGLVEGRRYSDVMRDPEALLSLSNTKYAMDEKTGKLIGGAQEPVRFALLNVQDGETQAQSVHHFEIDLVETREKYKPHPVKGTIKTGWFTYKPAYRQYFNEQVTHAGHLMHKPGSDKPGHICFINFEIPRILLVKDTKFKQSMV